jgi:hypothetical protein
MHADEVSCGALVGLCAKAPIDRRARTAIISGASRARTCVGSAPHTFARFVIPVASSVQAAIDHEKIRVVAVKMQQHAEGDENQKNEHADDSRQSNYGRA